MELFKLSTPDHAPEGCESLYFRVFNGSLNKKENYYKLSDDAIIATNTYFNIFSSSKYAEYTKAENITFTSKVSGKMDVCLHMCTQERDDVIKHVPVASETPVDVSLEFNIKGLSDREKITCHYVSFESKGSSKIHEFGSYSTDANQDDIRLALAICTFHREEYVNRTVNALRGMISDPTYDSEQIDIFIVDNGKTLEKDMFSEPFIHLIPNRNLGGSGGFTRGMIEACEHNATHVLLMDDDIILDPDAVYKTFNLLKILKEEHKDAFILGGMLDSNAPTTQYEASSFYNGQFTKRKDNLDLVSEKSLIFNDLFEYANYGAWWYMCMPTHICDNNLPLPLFIKMDDVEYGLRTMRDHVVMNGIGIWHENFDEKRNRVMENYYHERNSRITESVCKLDVRPFVFSFWHKVLYFISLSDYVSLYMYTRAIRDYTKGVDFLMNIDEEELHFILQEKDNSREIYRISPGEPKALIRKIVTWDFWRVCAKCLKIYIKYLIFRKRISKEYYNSLDELTKTEKWNNRLGRRPKIEGRDKND